jgi:RNA polymerase sigma factor (sigma-70 family)
LQHPAATVQYQVEGRVGRESSDMGIVRDGEAIRQVHRLFVSGTVVGLDEAQLLGRFVESGDEAAFAALVARHGPMVLGVCRRVLADSNDVDDAFQATFLILVRKARGLRERALLGNWLYGVAHRVAVRSRANASQRRSVERPGLDAIGEIPAREPRQSEVWPVLDEEIARLAEADRAAIVLCDLEGRSGEEAARLLGLKPVTFRSRLLRARRKLKGRLIRRGLTLQGGLATAALSFAPSETLAESTIEAAICFAAGPSTFGAIAAPVVALTEGVLRTMSLTRWKIATASLMALGLVATGAGVLAQSPSPEPRQRAANEDDRLRGLEQKLDRLIEALDAPRRGESPRDASQSYTTTRPPETRKAEPRHAYEERPYGVTKSAPAPTVAASSEWKSAIDEWVSQPEGRVARLERRFDRLEQRIARLEQLAAEKSETRSTGSSSGAALGKQ